MSQGKHEAGTTTKKGNYHDAYALLDSALGFGQLISAFAKTMTLFFYNLPFFMALSIVMFGVAMLPIGLL